MAYRVTFLPMNVPGAVGGGTARLDGALAGQVRLTHDCGGSCACPPCHVVVRGGWENLSRMGADEEDRLDLAWGLTARSRLACQAVVHDDVVGEIPAGPPPGAGGPYQER